MKSTQNMIPVVTATVVPFPNDNNHNHNHNNNHHNNLENFSVVTTLNTNTLPNNHQINQSGARAFLSNYPYKWPKGLQDTL